MILWTRLWHWLSVRNREGEEMIIIGISGKAGVGKDEFANVAVEQFGFLRRGFADGIKAEIMSMLGWMDIPYRHSQFWGDYTKKETPILFQTSDGSPVSPVRCLPFFEGLKHGDSFIPRELLQWVGEYGRGKDPLYWINRLFQNTQTERLIISDVRRVNELNAIRQRGGYIVRIHRNVPEGVVSNSGHASEVELDSYTDWDYTLVNDRKLKDFQTKAQVILKDILQRCEGRANVGQYK